MAEAAVAPARGFYGDARRRLGLRGATGIMWGRMLILPGLGRIGTLPHGQKLGHALVDAAGAEEVVHLVEHRDVG